MRPRSPITIQGGTDADRTSIHDLFRYRSGVRVTSDPYAETHVRITIRDENSLTVQRVDCDVDDVFARVIVRDDLYTIKIVDAVTMALRRKKGPKKVIAPISVGVVMLTHDKGSLDQPTGAHGGEGRV